MLLNCELRTIMGNKLKLVLLGIVFMANSKDQGKFTLASPAFDHQKQIPAKYTCDGENISPQIHWENAPEGTQSFALIVDDPDAPKKVWVHWVVFNIPADAKSLKEGIRTGNFVQGMTDFGSVGFGGPCPPSGTHRYYFKLYALDTILDLPEGATKEELLKAMNGHILDQTELIGLYQRKK